MEPKILARFNDKWQPVTESGCWLWTGATNQYGYGTFYAGGQYHKAHRFAYELHTGQPAGELMVCHKCDTPACINPDHLFLGTHWENMDDMDAKGRRRDPNPAGAHNGRAKITEEQLMAILADRRPNTVIAAEYGMARSSVSRIKNGRQWTHITRLVPLATAKGEK